MRSNSKAVRTIVREHILETYEGKGTDSVSALLADINAVLGMPSTPTVYHAGRYLVQGGSFLVYYSDIQKFLNSLGINPEKKEYSNEKSWELYQHLIGSEIEKIVSKEK